MKIRILNESISDTQPIKPYFNIRSSGLYNELTIAKPREYSYISNILNSFGYSNIYLVSDIHFLKDDNDELKIDHNNKIITEDKNCATINLGDIGFKSLQNFKLEKLRDKCKLLNKGSFSVYVLGNHDSLDMSFYKKVGYDIVLKEGFIYKNLVFTHIPVMDVNNPRDCINIHGHMHYDSIYDFPDYFPDILYGKSKRIQIYSKANSYYPFKLNEVLNN